MEDIDRVMSVDESDEFADIIKTISELAGQLRNRDDLVLACACERMYERLAYLFRIITEHDKAMRNKITLLKLEKPNEQPK